MGCNSPRFNSGSSFFVLQQNFASFLRSPASASLQRSDPTTYYGFASGRRGTSGLVAQITTLPRHDIIALAFTLGYKIYDLSWSPDSGKVNLEFELEHPTEGGKLPAGKEDIIWAIVRRHALMQVREARWDLASFGQPVEPKELSVLPNKQGEQFVILSENGQVTELFLRNSKGPSGILELLGSQEPAAKKAVKWLESIAISDIVAKRPDEPYVLLILFTAQAVLTSTPYIQSLGEGWQDSTESSPNDDHDSSPCITRCRNTAIGRAGSQYRRRAQWQHPV